MKFTTPVIMALLGATNAMKMKMKANDDTCAGLTATGPISSKKHGEVIENLYVYASPTQDTAVFIRHTNVTVKNVVVLQVSPSRTWMCLPMVFTQPPMRTIGVPTHAHFVLHSVATIAPTLLEERQTTTN